jgi:hypothetical protein
MGDIFVTVADFWHSVFGFIQDQEGVVALWKSLLAVPGIGWLLSFLEVTFGRGATPL